MGLKRIALRAPTIKKGIIHHRPPLGLHLIASFLRERGLEVDVIDSLIDPITPEQVAEKFNFLGQSSLYHSLPEDIEWVNAAKRANTNLFCFFGGPGAALDLNFIFAHSKADGVFQGEDPEDLLPIFEGDPHGAPGFIFRAGRPAPFTAKKWKECWEGMDWGEVPLEKYWEVLDSMGWSHQKTGHLITASHCPKNCGFCTFPALRRQAYGLHPEMCYRSNQQVYETIDEMKKAHPEMEQVFFHDDDFFLAPTKDRFFEEYPRRDLSFIVQTSEASARRIRDKIPGLRQAGVHTLCIGVENVASKLIEKRVDQEFLVYLAAELRQNEIQAYYYLILFTPDETLKSLEENLYFCRRIKGEGGQVSIAIGIWALTGTELAERYEADRIILNMNGRPVPYRTTLRVQDPQTEKIRQRVWQEIDTLNQSKDFISKQVYTDQLIARVEREIHAVSPSELYRELR